MKKILNLFLISTFLLCACSKEEHNHDSHSDNTCSVCESTSCLCDESSCTCNIGDCLCGE